MTRQGLPIFWKKLMVTKQKVKRFYCRKTLLNLKISSLGELEKVVDVRAGDCEFRT